MQVFCHIVLKFSITWQKLAYAMFKTEDIFYLDQILILYIFVSLQCIWKQAKFSSRNRQYSRWDLLLSRRWKYFTKQLIDLLDSCLSSTYKLSFITRNNYHFCKSIIVQISFSSHWYSSLLVKKVRAYMQFFRKRAKNVKKGQKSGKYLKIWAKMYTIWKYFEKGHVIGHDYHMQ